MKYPRLLATSAPVPSKKRMADVRVKGNDIILLSKRAKAGLLRDQNIPIDLDGQSKFTHHLILCLRFLILEENN